MLVWCIYIRKRTIFSFHDCSAHLGSLGVWRFWNGVSKARSRLSSLRWLFWVPNMSFSCFIEGQPFSGYDWECDISWMTNHQLSGQILREPSTDWRRGDSEWWASEGYEWIIVQWSGFIHFPRSCFFSNWRVACSYCLLEDDCWRFANCSAGSGVRLVRKSCVRILLFSTLSGRWYNGVAYDSDRPPLCRFPNTVFC